MNIVKYTTELDGDRLCGLVKEKTVRYCGEKFCMPDDIVVMLNTVFRLNRMTEEYVYLLCFDAAMHPLGVFEISHGSVRISMCCSREIMQKALLCNASQIIIAHNHPSGDPSPSKTDMEALEGIKQASELIGIQLADFLIVGDGTYYSYAENS